MTHHEPAAAGPPIPLRSNGAASAGGRESVRVIVITVTAAIVLLAREPTYAPRWHTVSSWLPEVASWRPEAWNLMDPAGSWWGTATSADGQWRELLWWALWQVLMFAALPIGVARFVLGDRPRDLGLKARGASSGGLWYLAMYAAMVPVILWVSSWEGFGRQYPFLKLPLPPIDAAPEVWRAWWTRMITWELAYAAQFLALEYFFRGFLTLGLEPVLKGHAVSAMVIGYALLHVGKPLPEALGSIVAGYVLGHMALRTRSVMSGAALHVAVAWSMDACAVARQAHWL